MERNIIEFLKSNKINTEYEGTISLYSAWANGCHISDGKELKKIRLMFKDYGYRCMFRGNILYIAGY